MKQCPTLHENTEHLQLKCGESPGNTVSRGKRQEESFCYFILIIYNVALHCTLCTVRLHEAGNTCSRFYSADLTTSTSNGHCTSHNTYGSCSCANKSVTITMTLVFQMVSSSHYNTNKLTDRRSSWILRG